MAAYKDYYETLGVPKAATEKEIRSAFRKLAAKHHPDRNPDDPGAEERFKEINEAYTVLSDPEKRTFYDQYGSTSGAPPFGGQPHGGQQPGGQPFGGGFPGGAQGGRVYSNVDPEQFAGFSDFFQTLFGGGAGVSGGFSSGGFSGSFGQGDPFGSVRRSPGPQQPSAEAEYPVDLAEAYQGGESTFTVGGNRVTVTLPPGVRHGQKLRLRGQAPGGGDLLLVVRHKPHPVFALDGDTIRVTVDVPAPIAALGGEVRVATLDGPVEMTLPAGSSSGRVLRLRGQGWPTKGGGRGDELAEVRVTVPADLTDEQREHWEALRGAVEVKEGAAAR